ncbi:CASP-like protein at2g28370-like protein, partial [Trifolium pratense]
GTAVSLFYLSFLPSSSFLLTQISLQFFFWCFGEEMNVSHASVHPVEEVPTTEAAVPVAGENLHVPMVRMKDIQGMPGTVGGLSLRISQFVFGAAALSIMASTSDFPSVTAFW